MNTVRHGLCIGGPKDRQSLATMQPGIVHHPDDASGFYVFKQGKGEVPKWLWISQKENENAAKPSS